MFPHLANFPVDMLDMETTNSSYDFLDLIRSYPSFDKYVSMGVVDVHSHVVEPLDKVKAGIRMGLEVLPPDKLFIDPDCGMKTRTEEECVAKLQVISDAVREVKQELGIE